MSEKKTIVFNDSLITNKTRKNNGVKKPKKEKPKPVIKPNTLKKSLLEKIKKHQQKEKITKTVNVSNNNTSNNDMEFHNNFINSMEYLNKISEKQTKEKREKKRKNKTLKKPQEAGNRKPPNITMEPLVSIDLPNDFDSNSSQPIFLSNFTENKLL